MESPNQFAPQSNSSSISPVDTVLPPSNSLVFKPKPKRKLWWKILLVIIVLLIIATLALLNIPRVLTLLYPADAQLIDNSALLLQKVAVPDSNNGYFDLASVTPSVLKIPKNSKGVAFDIEYGTTSPNLVWDQKLADQVLSDNREALIAFDSASKKDYFQIPELSDPAKYNPEFIFPSFSSWRSVARLQSIKAISLSKKGKSDEALFEALKIIKLSHNMIIGHNLLIGTLVSDAIKKIGLNTTFQILQTGSIKKSTLQSASTVLSASANDIQGYKDVFRFQYTNVSNSIDKTASSIDLLVQQMVKDGVVNSEYANYSKYGYYYKINQTKNLYTDLYNGEVSAVGNKCELDDLSAKIKTNIDDYSKRKLIFTENAIGKLMFSETGLSLGSFLAKQCQTDLLLKTVQIELALKEYQIDNKSLPLSVNDLVPTYLDKVPLNPFDSKPISSQNK